MSDHMNMEEYRKLTGNQQQPVGQRMSIDEYWKQQGVLPKDQGEPKRSKYNSRKTEYDGKIYDSAKEASYAQELDTKRRSVSESDRVTDISNQVEYKVIVNETIICRYYADFRVTYADGRIEVVDVKSEITAKNPVYRIKKKLVEALYQIKIIEV